jgi:hypothetical protein
VQGDHGGGDVARLAEAIWTLDTLADAGDVVRLAAGG